MTIKRWTVVVTSAIEAAAADGSQMSLQPGNYLMRQLDLSHYELAMDRIRLRIHIGDLLGYVQDGAMHIPGGFP